MSDEELHRIAVDFRDGILGNGLSASMCFAVSAPLQCFLSMAYGYETEMAEAVIIVDTDDGALGCRHWFLRLTDGRILDPTADQFKTPLDTDMPPVYLGTLPTWYGSVEDVVIEEAP